MERRCAGGVDAAGVARGEMGVVLRMRTGSGVAIGNSVPSGVGHSLAVHARGTRAQSMCATSRGIGGGTGSKAADQVSNGALPAGAVSRAGVAWVHQWDGELDAQVALSDANGTFATAQANTPQCSMSMWKTRLSRCILFMGAR